MSLLIDGYNLLHASEVFPAIDAPGTLANAREALVEFLGRMLTEKELRHTTIVFDARQAPPGLPRVVERGGLTMLFAPRTQSADEMLAELIDREPAPKLLTVVSSDHAVQRAARRRKARFVDSDEWCRELIAAHRARRQADHPPGAEKPDGALSRDEVDFWLDEFRQPPPGQ